MDFITLSNLSKIFISNYFDRIVADWSTETQAPETTGSHNTIPGGEEVRDGFGWVCSKELL
jgi:hypothetical protein